MKDSLLKIKNSIKKLTKTGFFSIILSQVLVKAIGFCNSILLARLLTKNDFGVYSYAQNILSVLLLLDGIGTISSIIQHASENYGSDARQSAYAWFGFKIGLSFNILLSTGIFIYACVGDLNIEGANKILMIMAFQPILSYVQSFCACNLRFRLENTWFSILNVITALLNVVAIVIGAKYGGVNGVVISLYFAYAVSILAYLALFLTKVNIFVKGVRLETYEKKSFVKMSLSASINDSIIHLIMVADLFLIGIIMSDELLIASYKVATVIPTALVFIPSSVMLFAYPYFARNKNDLKWIQKALLAALAFLALVNIFVVAILYSFAPFFIELIYGEQYLDAVPAFRILLIGYLFTGTIRTPLVNFLWSQKKNLFVIILSLTIGVVNIVLDVILIDKLGTIGAAYATMITYILSAILAIIFAGYQIMFLRKSLKKPMSDVVNKD